MNTTKEPPYLIPKKRVTVTTRAYNPNYGDGRLCGHCAHPYIRHFDPYEDYSPVGCKYCECHTFKDAK